MEEFTQLLNDLFHGSSISKITLSKPRQKSQFLQNIYIRPVALKGSVYYSATLHFVIEDLTKNWTPDEARSEILRYLSADFYNADVITDDVHYTLLQSKKGKNHLVRKAIGAKPTKSLQHDRIKNRLIPASRPYLTDLGIVSSQGKVYSHAQKKFKQINKFVEILDALIAPADVKDSFSIIDMGSGKGYLSFALFDHLQNKYAGQINLTGIEIRKDLADKCNAIGNRYDMHGLEFQTGNIEDTVIGKTDMIIALHACDIATDMAIAKGIEAGARYIVVAPCCHKQIRKEMQGGALLAPILKHGILMERQAEMVTDGIRSLLLESQGYSTKAFEFISSEHTGKNLMITAVKHKPNPEALTQIEAIKKHFGIKEHYLEKLLRD